MKKFTLIAACIAVMFLVSSCATHFGGMSGSAALSSKNFRYQGLATGQAQTLQVFGLGGLAKDGLVAEAKKNLLLNYPLKDGQALANVTVDFKFSVVFFVIIRKATVTADIVEFNQ
jgi:hypothetical protein